MKKEQLLEKGISEEVAKEILKINGDDIENAKLPLTEKLTKAESERDGLQKQLDAAGEALKRFEGIDPANMKDELKKAQDALAEAQAKHAADIAARDSRAETERFLADKRFINDITRAHFVTQIETSLADPANKGKNRQDLFDALSKGEDGKDKPGIFAEESPNKLLNLPPSGPVAPGATDTVAAKVARRYAAAKAAGELTE